MEHGDARDVAASRSDPDEEFNEGPADCLDTQTRCDDVRQAKRLKHYISQAHQKGINLLVSLEKGRNRPGREDAYQQDIW